MAKKTVFPFQSIALSGASSGIGAALALELAVPGRVLLLIARHAERLENVAQVCRARGAQVRTALIDVREREALARLLLRFDAEEPIDLLIANAGVSAGLGPSQTPEAEGVSRRLMEINYGGVLNMVEPLLPAMIARRRGRIALVSSLAAWRPQPDLPSYSASKMAVRGYGIALRGWLEPQGIGVSLIYPGFVTSPMSLRHKGKKPFELSAERAAQRIVTQLGKGRRVIAFPTLLAMGAFLNMLLPAKLSDKANAPFRAEVLPDGGE